MEAVKQVTERGLHVAEVSARLGMSMHSLYAWGKPLRQPPRTTAARGRSSGRTQAVDRRARHPKKAAAHQRVRLKTLSTAKLSVQ
ncbi:hypothetical protein D7236_22060 [Stutzerimonas stutzeri]|nr:hypothetical protein [Stutzerimonas stutzeri]